MPGATEAFRDWPQDRAAEPNKIDSRAELHERSRHRGLEKRLPVQRLATGNNLSEGVVDDQFSLVRDTDTDPRLLRGGVELQLVRAV